MPYVKDIDYEKNSIAEVRERNRLNHQKNKMFISGMYSVEELRDLEGKSMEELLAIDKKRSFLHVEINHSEGINRVIPPAKVSGGMGT